MTTAPKLQPALDIQYPAKLILPHQVYLDRPEVSNSLLQRVGQSPRHAVEWMKSPPEPTPSMVLGTTTHAAILQPDVFKDTYCVAPRFDKRTKAGKEAHEAWVAANPGKQLLNEDDFNQIIGMIESVYNHPTASETLSDGWAELSLFWQDPEHGLGCKCRPDYLKQGLIIDVKTTEDASERSFMRSILNFGYHQQAAFYLDGVSEVIGVRHERFIIIAVEKKAPYAVAVYELDHAALEKGQELYLRNLDRWAECLTSNRFPAYSEGVQAIGLPHWGFDE